MPVLRSVRETADPRMPGVMVATDFEPAAARGGVRPVVAAIESISG